MNKNVVAGLGVAVTFLTGLLVITVAKQVNTEDTTTTSVESDSPVMNNSYKQPTVTNTNSVSTSVEVTEAPVVNASVTVSQ